MMIEIVANNNGNEKKEHIITLTLNTNMII